MVTSARARLCPVSTTLLIVLAGHAGLKCKMFIGGMPLKKDRSNLLGEQHLETLIFRRT